MKKFLEKMRSSSRKLIWLFCASLLFACETDQLPQDNPSGTEEGLNLKAGKKSIHHIVDVVASPMNLEVRSNVLSGWTTFRFVNKTGNTHFFVLEKLPEGKTFHNSIEEVVPVFQRGMTLIAEDKWDEALAAFGNLPPWSANIIYSGGVGLVSPGGEAQTTVFLEPGNYTLECYVKTSGNIFHSAMGMITGLEVNTRNNDFTAPKATMEVSISSGGGIIFDEKVRPGKHIIQVNFEDQMVYGHFLGHDVHLVKLEDNANIAELNSWMNWADPAGFISPAPEGVVFMGGIQELPALEGKPNSSVGYFEAHLKPGTYAFISEVPDPTGKNMLQVFNVPSASGN